MTLIGSTLSGNSFNGTARADMGSARAALSLSRSENRTLSSVRRLRQQAATVDIDAGGREGAVRIFGGSRDVDGFAGRKLALVGDHETADRHARSDDDLLLAVLIFH